jgi:hypothetical protein
MLAVLFEGDEKELCENNDPVAGAVVWLKIDPNDGWAWAACAKMFVDAEGGDENMFELGDCCENIDAPVVGAANELPPKSEPLVLPVVWLKIDPDDGWAWAACVKIFPVAGVVDVAKMFVLLGWFAVALEPPKIDDWELFAELLLGATLPNMLPKLEADVVVDWRKTDWSGLTRVLPNRFAEAGGLWAVVGDVVLLASEDKEPNNEGATGWAAAVVCRGDIGDTAWTPVGELTFVNVDGVDVAELNALPPKIDAVPVSVLNAVGWLPKMFEGGVAFVSCSLGASGEQTFKFDRIESVVLDAEDAIVGEVVAGTDGVITVAEGEGEEEVKEAPRFANENLYGIIFKS